MLIALLIDRGTGDPDFIWSRIPHPVVWFGKIILYGDHYGNKPTFSQKRRKFHGMILTCILLTVAVFSALLLVKLCNLLGVLGLLLQTILVSIFLAQKSLRDHTLRVYYALEKGDLTQARRDLAMIVGRNIQQFQEAEISSAAIETLAENSSDGVIAPAFWFLLLGLPGLLAYKAINTADSMIGYKTIRYRAFGCSAARLDDFVNYIPARLTGLMIVCASWLMNGKKAAHLSWKIMHQDANHHASPNAGWPESAFAGGLDLRLSGPRMYGTDSVDAPFQNKAGRIARHVDIAMAIQLFDIMMLLFTLLIIVGILFMNGFNGAV